MHTSQALGVISRHVPQALKANISRARTLINFKTGPLPFRSCTETVGKESLSHQLMRHSSTFKLSSGQASLILRKLSPVYRYSLFNDTRTAGEKIIECYKNNQLLIRTLYPGFWKTFFEPLEWELDELIHKMERRSSSASFIPYKIPVYPLGQLGIILEIEKCDLEGVYYSDAAVMRIDIADRHISWSKPLKTHVLASDNSTSLIRPNIRHKALWSYSKVESIENLKSRMKKDSLMNKHKPLLHNEVVVGYNKESIVGIATILNNEQSPARITNDKIIDDSKRFKSIIFKSLGIDLPVLFYDCSNAELSLDT